jgi:arylsulfatase A-like enzyme
MLEAVDTELGRLIAALDLSDTTLFVMGDNGTWEPASGGPHPTGHWKGTMFEGGLHVPMLVAGAAVDPARVGSEIPEIVMATDVFATVAEIACSGETAPDSVSLIPYLEGPSAPPQRGVVVSEAFWPTGKPPMPDPSLNWLRAAREDCFKLILTWARRPNGGAVTYYFEGFYDLCVDPTEESPLGPEALTLAQERAFITLGNAMDLPEPSRSLLWAAALPVLALLAHRRGKPLWTRSPE